jgi:hypothetical protein
MLVRERSVWSQIRANFFPSKALHQVIIHHPHGLHEGITNRRTDEAEAALEQVTAHLF